LAGDEAAREKVANALAADPYFYDAHVRVSARRGKIVLQGFVFGDWDLRDALRIARRAAGSVPVIDELSIKAGGRR
jgi:osmotically-inducible protein OsmY